jgi:hypothetical protein
MGCETELVAFILYVTVTYAFHICIYGCGFAPIDFCAEGTTKADIAANVSGSNFIGEKIVRKVIMHEGVDVEPSKNQKDELQLTGISLENVSQSAADIQQACRVRNKDIRKVGKRHFPNRKSKRLTNIPVLGRYLRFGARQPAGRLDGGLRLAENGYFLGVTLSGLGADYSNALWLVHQSSDKIKMNKLQLFCCCVLSLFVTASDWLHVPSVFPFNYSI